MNSKKNIKKLNNMIILYMSINSIEFNKKYEEKFNNTDINK
jgi:hypothetical protein